MHPEYLKGKLNKYDKDGKPKIYQGPDIAICFLGEELNVDRNLKIDLDNMIYDSKVFNP